MIMHVIQNKKEIIQFIVYFSSASYYSDISIILCHAASNYRCRGRTHQTVQTVTSSQTTNYVVSPRKEKSTSKMTD